jgi:hypothetical protein
MSCYTVSHQICNLYYIKYVSTIFGPERAYESECSFLKAIQKADRQMVEKLADAPRILSYSSLELRNGDWCNLVVMTDADVKMHIKGNETHKHAVYQLAHSYYEWIRLHSGVMPEGLDHMEMRSQKTRYYSFHAPETRPVVRELVY